MEGAATLSVRINSQVKHDAETVLGQLGLSMSTAVGMFLRQVVMTKSIPFTVSVPQAPRPYDLAAMSDAELHALLRTALGEASGDAPAMTVAEVRSELL